VRVAKKMSELHGYYSAKQALAYGCVIYTLLSGDEVEVTEVHDNPNEKSNYEDMCYVGRLKEFVRKGRDGEHEVTYIYIVDTRNQSLKFGEHNYYDHLIKHPKK
jgi:hypothetical protein